MDSLLMGDVLYAHTKITPGQDTNVLHFTWTFLLVSTQLKLFSVTQTMTPTDSTADAQMLSHYALDVNSIDICVFL
jgi:hypothetical protein